MCFDPGHLSLRSFCSDATGPLRCLKCVKPLGISGHLSRCSLCLSSLPLHLWVTGSLPSFMLLQGTLVERRRENPTSMERNGVRGSHSGRFLQSPKVIIWSSSHFPSHPTKYSLVQIKREHMHTCTHIPLLLRGRVRTTARIPVPEVAGLGSFCAITPSLTHISTPLERICLLGLP